MVEEKMSFSRMSLDWRQEGHPDLCTSYPLCHGFDSWPFHFHVTTLGKLFTHTCACVIKQYSLALPKGGDTVRLGKSWAWQKVIALTAWFVTKLPVG